MKYSIIAHTNEWIAQRDRRFNGKCEITLYKDLSKSEANTIIMELFEEDYEVFYKTWSAC